MALLGSVFIAFGVFLSGFVISEPAPYELLMAALIGIWALFGLRISRSVAPLLVLIVLITIGGLLAMTVMSDLAEAPMYMAVSAFLGLTAVFFAAVIEDRWQRLTFIRAGWIAAGVGTALLGILGYFGAIPGASQFTLYDRAKGAFQDPNVFGPFLVTPSLFLLHGILTGRLRHLLWRMAGALIMALGVLLSFSRAAWGLYVVCVLALVFVMLLKERSAAFRVKIIMLFFAGTLLLLATIVIALQFEQVSALLASRTQLVQDYDAGPYGRFGRHLLGYQLALERPLGIGPLVFGKIYGQDTHNIWLKFLLDYGWLGFVSYVGLLAWTLSLGFRYLLRDRPWQPYLMISWISLVGHALIGNLIDTDHWRHFYLLFGIIWGCAALEHRTRKRVSSEA